MVSLDTVSGFDATSNVPLPGITITYVFAVISERPSQWFIDTLEASVINRSFMSSLSTKSGLVFENLYDFRLTDNSPTSAPSANPLVIQSQSGKRS